MKKLITILFLFTCLFVQAQEGTSIPQVTTGGGGASDGVVTGGTINNLDIDLTRSIGGAIALSKATLSTAADATLVDETVAYGDCTGGVVTFTLPAPTIGKSIEVGKTDLSANPLKLSGTFVGGGSETVIYDNYSVIITGNGTAWQIKY